MGRSVMTIPLAAQYFLAVLFVLALSSAFTVMVLNLHNRGDLGEEVPMWMRKLIMNWLAKITGMADLVEINQRKHKATSTKV